MSAARPEVRITAGAERDLRAIYERRLAQRETEGEDGADALLDELIAALEPLGDRPAKGPVVPEMAALGIRDYRQLSLPPFRMIYLPADDVVTVVVIADSRRDFHTLLAERVLGGCGG